MAPRPLKTLVKEPVGYVTGPAALSHQHDLACEIMGLIASWSIIELSLANVLVLLLGAQARPAMAMFSALTSSQAQIAALKAAGRTVLPLQYQDTFEAVVTILRRSAKKRHKLAHWIWAFSGRLPDALLLIEPEQLILHVVDHEEEKHRAGCHATFKTPFEGIWVYKKPDLDEIQNDFAAIQSMVQNLQVLATTLDAGDLAHRRLLSEPRIQTLLAKMKRSPLTSLE